MDTAGNGTTGIEATPGGRRHRCFVGIPAPDDLRDALAEQAHAVRVGCVRWTRPEKLHLTLVFLGNVSEPQIAALQRLLSDVKRPRMHLDITEPELFERPGALVLHVAPNPALLALQARVQHAAVLAGIPVEDRPYRPHITLGRLARGTRSADRQLARAALARSRSGLQLTRFQPAEVTLFESLAGMYRPIAAFPMNGS